MSAPDIPPPLTPNSSWEDLIAAAEKRTAAAASDRPRLRRSRVAVVPEPSTPDVSEPNPEPTPLPPSRREAEAAPAGRNPPPPCRRATTGRAHWRHGCDWLALFPFVAGRAAGTPAAAAASRWPACSAGVRNSPDSVRQFVIGMMRAQDEGLPFEEAFEDVADYHDAYFAWLAGLQAARRKR